MWWKCLGTRWKWWCATLWMYWMPLSYSWNDYIFCYTYFISVFCFTNFVSNLASKVMNFIRALLYILCSCPSPFPAVLFLTPDLLAPCLPSSECFKSQLSRVFGRVRSKRQCCQLPPSLLYKENISCPLPAFKISYKAQRNAVFQSKQKDLYKMFCFGFSNF